MPALPDDPMAAFRAAADLGAAGPNEAAVEAWAELTHRFPQSPEAWCNLGRVLTGLSRLEYAEEALRRALALKPDAPWAQHSLAVLQRVAGRSDEAEATLRATVVAHPAYAEARLELGHIYLERGDYARGWPLYEARKDVPGPHQSIRLDLPEWRGEPLAGKRLLVWQEQGFGDMIQFARFIPTLVAQATEVTWVCPPDLIRLFGGLGARLVAFSPELTLAAPDVWTLPLDIAGRLGVTLETIPRAPYLSVPAETREKWRGYAPPGAVGIVWHGNPRHANDRNRSLPSRDSMAPLAAHGPLVDLQEPLGDFADLAAVIEQLDLLVTVDTAAAHLAGALGKEAWVLLPAIGTDWRWLADRSYSPWYPTLRLFRQGTPGDWRPVIAEVSAALAARRGG